MSSSLTSKDILSWTSGQRVTVWAKSKHDAFLGLIFFQENTLGRKKTNYPKRSQIIKVDKETGELIYPPKHPAHKDNSDKQPVVKLEPGSQEENTNIGKPPGSVSSHLDREILSTIIVFSEPFNVYLLPNAEGQR